MIIILKAIFGWLIFTFVGTNLIGMIVRGLIQPLPKPEVNEPLLNNLFLKHKRANNIITIVFIIISIIYFYILYHFWNIGIAISAVMIMFSRIPDLLDEIKTGQKIKFWTKPKRPLDYFVIIIQWGALLVLWYSLHILK